MNTTMRQKQKHKAWVAGFIAGLNAQELPPIISTDLQDAANSGYQAGASARDLESESATDFILEINKFHDESGKFSSQATAKTASVTKKAAEEANVDAERGSVNTSTGKVYAKYGANTGNDKTQAGRLNFNTSKPKPKTRSLKDYPKTYDEIEEVMDGADDAYVKALIRQEFEALRRARSEGKSHGSVVGSSDGLDRLKPAAKKRQIRRREDK